MFMGFSLVGLVEEHRLFGGGPAKGFCTGDLGRTVDFQVVATGSQHHMSTLHTLNTLCINEFDQIHKSSLVIYKRRPWKSQPFRKGE